MSVHALSQATERLADWMVRQALPLWSSQGFDQLHGSAFEQLDASGAPDAQCPKRIRVQYRQSFVFSVAANRGWLAEAGVRVGQIQRWLDAKARHPNAQHADAMDLYVHQLTAEDQPLDNRLDTYDLAFYLLACAWRYRAFGDSQALARANRIQRYLDTHIKGDFGGWREGDYPAKVRRQNPHMHLFEAYMALFQASADSRWLARAGSIFTLFETRFYDPEKHFLLEYFHPDWRPVAEGQAVEPGHMLEWVWLLHQYGQLSGTPVTHYTRSLYRTALELGQEKHSGLLFDELDTNGKVQKASKRLWPMTELIKASLAEAASHSDASSKAAAELVAANAISALFEFYFSTRVDGSYCDQLDANNQVINTKAPASTLYHLLVAATEAIDYQDQQR
ncbi:AGE family epimerase/isomerase [Simiduia agarivorans]|uniref:Mannose-6-phosphate isomerase n=1 Tax=Simiduia agarivorans (strain DSM 21679 / JCM 13881 / BCRC 17597 / SA1) TaxID=1117647 RepID=K4KQT1_SIMAS|nr:AGE family epimerase/isomerase [Simiduia agarivorans]AFV00484.1 mannose-6-phosphate isomerase [Simiduia agarivorans SA1 = DSM 21679]